MCTPLDLLNTFPGNKLTVDTWHHETLLQRFSHLNSTKLAFIAFCGFCFIWTYLPKRNQWSSILILWPVWTRPDKPSVTKVAISCRETELSQSLIDFAKGTSHPANSAESVLDNDHVTDNEYHKGTLGYASTKYAENEIREEYRPSSQPQPIWTD